jgi:hypothetical protein
MILEVKQIWDFYHSIRVGAGLPKAEGRDLGHEIKSWLELGTKLQMTVREI